MNSKFFNEEGLNGKLNRILVRERLNYTRSHKTYDQWKKMDSVSTDKGTIGLFPLISKTERENQVDSR